MAEMQDLITENQNLKEIIEVAKQISSSLDIDYILKNINYIMLGKFNSACSCYVLAKDIDDDSPVFHIFRGTKREIRDAAAIKTLSQAIDFFATQEFNQITFSQFAELCKDTTVSQELAQFHPEFIIPLKAEKGIIGLFLQGKRSDGNSYSMTDIEFCINVLSFTSIALENANLFRQATVDRMTKLYTHHQFQKRLDEEIKKGQRYNTKFSLIMFDIDHFKLFNDNYGHLQGDIIIKEIARILRESVRDVDFPCRYGGEEYMTILPETDVKYAVQVAQRLRQTVEAFDFPGENGPFKVTISVGVTDFQKDFVNCNEDLIELVDKALYHSKESGRNQVTRSKYVDKTREIKFYKV